MYDDLKTMRLFLLSLVLVVFWIGPQTFALVDIPLVINEFMASNSSNSGIFDPQGDYDDWIEIHNFGSSPINVGDMYLTDDLSAPTKWRIPANNPAATTIPAGGYLVI